MCLCCIVTLLTYETVSLFALLIQSFFGRGWRTAGNVCFDDGMVCA